MSSRPLRGIPGGTIRPLDGWLISIRVELGQVGCTSSAFVIGKRSRDLVFLSGAVGAHPGAAWEWRRLTVSRREAPALARLWQRSLRGQ
jgi:hypothetical protein